MAVLVFTDFCLTFASATNGLHGKVFPVGTLYLYIYSFLFFLFGRYGGFLKLFGEFLLFLFLPFTRSYLGKHISLPYAGYARDSINLFQAVVISHTFLSGKTTNTLSAMCCMGPYRAPSPLIVKP